MKKIFESFVEKTKRETVYPVDVEFISFIQENIDENGMVDVQKFISEAMDQDAAIRQIEKAIDEMRYIGIYYEDKSEKDAGFRLIEPFVLGKGFKRRGKENPDLADVYYLRAYVVRESAKDDFTSAKFANMKHAGVNIKNIKSRISKKGSTDWRLFRVDKISKMQLLEQTFQFERPYYNPDDKSFIEIIAAVPKSKLDDPDKFTAVSSTDPDINFVQYDYVGENKMNENSVTKNEQKLKRAILKVSDVIKNSNYKMYATHDGKISNDAFKRLSLETKFHYLFPNKQGQELVFVDKETQDMYVVTSDTINKLTGIKTSFPFSEVEYLFESE